MYLTWASFNNMRMLLMASMPIVIFYLIWLINTSESIRSEEGTLLDLVCWPDGNAIPVLIALGAVIAVVIELYGLYQLFKAGLPRKEYDVTNGLYYYVWAIIIIIIIFLAIMFYSGLQSTIIREKIKGGITKAMLRYATHLPSKVAIDRLQTRFHCCGRVNYQEWFYIPWFTTGESVDSKAVTENRKFVADNVPYSCCSMDALYPCIHHRVMEPGHIYKYDPNAKGLRVSTFDVKQNYPSDPKPNKFLGPPVVRGPGDCTASVKVRQKLQVQKQLTISKEGCEEKLIKEMMAVSMRFNAVMALLIVAMILQVITVRYLHTAYKSGLHVANQICCQAYLLRSTHTGMLEISRQKTYRRRRQSETRTQQWVSTRLKPNKRRYTTTASEPESSDEFLKRIDE